MTSSLNLHLNSHLILGPLLAIIVYALMINAELSHAASATAAVTLLTAWWWATEALPIPATSLLPFALLPLLGVIDHKKAASGLGSHVILLMLGGFIMAKALEQTGAHKRLAIAILRAVGTSSYKRMLAAFMLTASLLSMWISNTATCIMLIPIVLASLKQIEQPELGPPLVLAVAYACSIGGIATLVGTPPNIIFAGVFEEAMGYEFGFLNWAAIGFPVVALLLPVTWLWLSRCMKGGSEIQLPELGTWSQDEKRVLGVFALVVLLWVFRGQPFGGWSGVIGIKGIGDSTVAMLGALTMFIVRSSKGGGILSWEKANDIPWGVLLMFAAGITIAKAFFSSGLADHIGVGLNNLTAGLPIFLLILLICLSVTFFTEVNSNLATTTLILPILAATALNASLPIELLMIPATISASCAFMLPVATAPNAIAYSTNLFPVKTMLRQGLVLNLIHAVLITGVCYFLLA